MVARSARGSILNQLCFLNQQTINVQGMSYIWFYNSFEQLEYLGNCILRLIVVWQPSPKVFHRDKDGTSCGIKVMTMEHREWLCVTLCVAWYLHDIFMTSSWHRHDIGMTLAWYWCDQVGDKQVTCFNGQLISHTYRSWNSMLLCFWIILDGEYSWYHCWSWL